MTEPRPRRAPRPGLIMLGVLAAGSIASIPLIALGQRPAPRAPSTMETIAAGSGAVIAAVAEQKPATPAEGAPLLGRPYRRTAVQPGDGAEPVEPPDFQCKPVKEDDSVAADQYPVPLPPFSRDVFPCSRCHDKPTDFNMTPRNLTLEHRDIELRHGPRDQWCYGCHNPTNRDTLRLAGGREISFLESYQLCGQCHGDKLRDWRLGIHGRRSGCWNGKREYLLCVHCHNQHSPKFKPLHPMPRPRRPSEIQPRSGS